MRFEKHTYEMQIKEHHLDTFGHVNNAMYIALLEEARWEAMTERGFGIPWLKKEKIGPVILDIAISYQKELINREHIRIETAVVNYESKVGVLKHRILKENDEVSAVAEMKFSLMDLRERKLIPPTDEWMAALGFAKD